MRFRKMIKSGVTLCFLHSLVQLSTWRWTTVSASNNPPSVSRAQVMLQRSLGLWSPVANWMYLSPLKLFTVSIFNRYLHDLKSLYALLTFQKLELSIKKNKAKANFDCSLSNSGHFLPKIFDLKPLLQIFIYSYFHLLYDETFLINVHSMEKSIDFVYFPYC